MLRIFNSYKEPFEDLIFFSVTVNSNDMTKTSLTNYYQVLFGLKTKKEVKRSNIKVLSSRKAINPPRMFFTQDDGLHSMFCNTDLLGKKSASVLQRGGQNPVIVMPGKHPLPEH